MASLRTRSHLHPLPVPFHVSSRKAKIILPTNKIIQIKSLKFPTSPTFTKKLWSNPGMPNQTTSCVREPECLASDLLLNHFTHQLHLKLAAQGALLDQMALHLTRGMFRGCWHRGWHLSYTNDDWVRRKLCWVRSWLLFIPFNAFCFTTVLIVWLEHNLIMVNLCYMSYLIVSELYDYHDLYMTFFQELPRTYTSNNSSNIYLFETETVLLLSIV